MERSENPMERIYASPQACELAILNQQVEELHQLLESLDTIGPESPRSEIQEIKSFVISMAREMTDRCTRLEQFMNNFQGKSSN